MQDVTRAVKRFLDGGEGLWLAPGEGVPPPGCAVVATSGSTGDAKLVVLHREALIAAARAAEKRLGFTGTWHLALAPHYVAGLMVLVRGLIGDGVRAAGADLSGLAPAPGRNCLSIVGTQLYRALEQPSVHVQLARFDAVLVGGAALRPELRARAEAAGIPVIETYGMSETCGGVVWDGQPLPGVEITLGEHGRIGIGGPMVFEGYLDGAMPLETPRENRRSGVLPGGSRGTRGAELDEGRGSGVLPGGSRGTVLTNDRGHWADGRLVIDGRFDDVVITGGVNVDLAAVRRVALAVEPDSEVLAVPDPEWGARIVLFAPNGTLKQWRERLRPHLPAAALPRQLVTVDTLPRTDGGKPARKTLLELVQS